MPVFSTVPRHFFSSLAVAGSLLLAQSAMAQDESSLQRIERTKVLRIGVISGATPYFHKDLVKNEWQGFGPDFAQSLATKLGAKVERVETTWGNAVMDLQANKIDVMFGMGPTPQRREMIDFSDMLFNNTLTVVCKKGYPEVKTWEQLNDPSVKIVVDVGSNQDQFATKTLPKASIARLDSSGAASMAVQTGRADCQVLMVLLAQPLLAKRPDMGKMFVPEPVTTSTVHVGLRKSANKDLENKVNEWIKQERAAGEVQKVIVHNMEKLAGVKPESFPKQVKF
ncbi:MAG: transporter substrate-binding domain-containing protein [Acidovorax sp.]|jgi:polar amino acid transport system substrate-binding protein|nr:transporter substrate-binding domain-containing protein [Acidovorax sp.]MDR3006184.1 transporter substrate-binding domain-containing protein [Acidovorax sp.]